MLFLKWFDCSRQTLLGQGKVFANKNNKVSELNGIIQEKMGWPSSTPIKLFEVCHQAVMLHRALTVHTGNQSRYDREHEDEADVLPKRNSGWRRGLLSGGDDRKGVRLLEFTSTGS